MPSISAPCKTSEKPMTLFALINEIGATIEEVSALTDKTNIALFGPTEAVASMAGIVQDSDPECTRGRLQNILNRLLYLKNELAIMSQKLQ